MKEVIIPLLLQLLAPIKGYWGWWVHTEYCDYNKNTFLDSTKFVDS